MGMVYEYVFTFLLLLVRETEDPGWLEGRLVDNNQVGLVPTNYIRIEVTRNVVCFKR